MKRLFFLLIIFATVVVHATEQPYKSSTPIKINFCPYRGNAKRVTVEMINLYRSYAKCMYDQEKNIFIQNILWWSHLQVPRNERDVALLNIELTRSELNRREKEGTRH